MQSSAISRRDGGDSGQSVLSSLETTIRAACAGSGRSASGGHADADIGCGRGRIVNRLAELYREVDSRNGSVSGAVLTAWEEAAEKKLRNVEFMVTDLSNFDEKAEDEAFDLVTTFDPSTIRPNP